MAQKRTIKIDIPELNRSKDQKHLTSGACRLTLETDKAYRGGVDCTAQVSWVDENGWGTMALGIGGGGDFHKTYVVRPGVATQKRIDTMHAEIFTPERIEQIKDEVRAYYAPNPDKERKETAARENQVAMGNSVKELMDGGMTGHQALCALNID